MAARTSRVRLGTMLTPLPWRRPWKVASQVATVDQLSGGRAVLAVGVGALWHRTAGYGRGDRDPRPRAEMLDEAHRPDPGAVGRRRRVRGQHYHFRSGRFDLASAVRPAQDRIPLWVVGVWPRPKSMRRVLRCDGIIPQFGADSGGPEVCGQCGPGWPRHGARAGLDVVADGETLADDATAAATQVRALADAGATWWLETRWGMPDNMPERIQDMTDRLAAGPPGPGPRLRDGRAEARRATGQPKAPMAQGDAVGGAASPRTTGAARAADGP